MRGENILSVPRRQGQGQKPGPGAGFVVLRHKQAGGILCKKNIENHNCTLARTLEGL